MNKIERMQLKRAAIVMKALADTMKSPEMRLEILELTSIIIKAVKELERDK